MLASIISLRLSIPQLPWGTTANPSQLLSKLFASKTSSYKIAINSKVGMETVSGTWRGKRYMTIYVKKLPYLM